MWSPQKENSKRVILLDKNLLEMNKAISTSTGAKLARCLNHYSWLGSGISKFSQPGELEFRLEIFPRIWNLWASFVIETQWQRNIPIYTPEN